MKVLADGRILMMGDCIVTVTNNLGQMTTAPQFCATRLQPDGTYDPTFGPGGVGYVRFDHFPGWPASSSLRDMILLHDGRVALVGKSVDGTAMLIAVMLADGTGVDPAVGSGAGFFSYQFGGTVSSGNRLREQPDGKILVAGQAIGVNGNNDLAIARFMPNFSSLDPDFGNTGYQTIAFDLGGPSGDNSDTASAVDLTSDGKIVVVGVGISSPAGSSDLRAAIEICRLTSTGQRDATFGASHDGRVHLTGQKVAAAFDALVDSSDRVVIGGTSSEDLVTTDWFVQRLAADGGADATFNGGAPQIFQIRENIAGPGQTLSRLALLPDGIVGVGPASRSNNSAQFYFGVARLNLDGSLDDGFGIHGRSFSSFAPSSYDDGVAGVAVTDRGIVVSGWGQLTASGTGSDQKFGVARLQYDRIFGNSFDN